MKVFDCFTFYNEQELLRIRLNEMNDFVDYFVIVEASETFTGIAKPFYLDECTEWLQPWISRIIRVKVILDGYSNDPWKCEHFQRNQIVQGLYSAKDNDLILISDVDEIINTKVLKSLKKIKEPVQIDNTQYFWNFNWQVPDHCNQGARPVACKKSHLSSVSPQDLRAAQLQRVLNGGWHFSYFSNVENIAKKIESFAHTEYNLEEYKQAEKVLYRMQNGIDPFDRFPLKYSEIDDSYPLYIQNNYK